MITKISANFFNEKKSILQISGDIYEILIGLSKIQSLFEYPILKGNNVEELIIDLNLPSKIIKKEIANQIAIISKEDVLKHEKVEIENLHFSRNFGFSFMIQYVNSKGEITFTGKLGSSFSNGLGVLSNNGEKLSLSTNINIIKSLISNSNVSFATVKISEITYLKEAKNFIYPLGIVSFFSTNIPFNIPQNISELYYKFEKNGILISPFLDTSLEFLTVTFFEINLLINCMKKISEIEPTYHR